MEVIATFWQYAPVYPAGQVQAPFVQLPPFWQTILAQGSGGLLLLLLVHALKMSALVNMAIMVAVRIIFVLFIVDLFYCEQKNSVVEILHAVQGSGKPTHAKDTTTPYGAP